MATATLKKGKTKPEPEEVPDVGVSEPTTTTANTAVAPVGNGSSALVMDQSGGAIEGDLDSSDLKPPRLQIVNGNGPLSVRFNGGTTLLDDEVLWDPPKPNSDDNPVMKTVPIRMKKEFREVLTKEEQAADQQPRTARGLADIAEMGGMSLNPDGKPRWVPSATVLFLLQEPPATEHPGFAMEADGKNWSVAVCYLQGNAYRQVFKPLVTAVKTVLKDGDAVNLSKYVWSWEVQKQQFGNFTVFVPIFKRTKEKTGPEALGIAAGMLTG